jgi:hypothetical protein
MSARDFLDLGTLVPTARRRLLKKPRSITDVTFRWLGRWTEQMDCRSFICANPGRGESRGEARNADPGPQSERPRMKRQSGVVGIDGRLRLELH